MKIFVSKKIKLRKVSGREKEREAKREREREEKILGLKMSQIFFSHIKRQDLFL